MNKSEQLLSVFSEDYFFKELVCDNLCYTPTDSAEIELADLIINLDDVIIAIQLKERNEHDQTSDIAKENKWLEKKCKVAKEQVKETIRLISSGDLPSFPNKRDYPIIFRSDAEVIPLVVFLNDQIDAYPHLLRKHSEDGVDINCMSFYDYAEMCKVLISPIEIVRYLEYRKRIYAEHGDVNIMILDGADDELVIARPTRNESLTHVYLAETYGMNEARNCVDAIQFFRNFLHKIPNHIVDGQDGNKFYEILLFLAHMNRIEISKFWSMLDDTKKESEQGRTGVLHSLRPKENDYAVLFVSGGIVPIDALFSIVRKKFSTVKRVLEVSIYWIDDKEFAIDFVYRNEERKE